MIVTTKFSPTDIIWFVHPLTLVISSAPVEKIDINVNLFLVVTILNYVSVGTLSFYINDDKAFATQAALLLAYAPQIAAAGVGAITLTGLEPIVTAAP